MQTNSQAPDVDHRQVVEEATGVPLTSLHHDISSVTGEEVRVFSLAAAPPCRPKRKP